MGAPADELEWPASADGVVEGENRAARRKETPRAEDACRQLCEPSPSHHGTRELGGPDDARARGQIRRGAVEAGRARGFALRLRAMLVGGDVQEAPDGHG